MNNDMITVAICPQCGGYTVVVTREYMTDDLFWGGE